MEITPEAEARDLLAKIDARRAEVLRQVLEVGSGSWRKDLETFLVRTGRVGLDDLFILSGDEPDNLWTEVMARLMLSSLWEDRNELEDCRREAVNDTLSDTVFGSRAQLTCRILSPAERVIAPVGLGFCSAAVMSLLRDRAGGSNLTGVNA
jgi:hypothetical protein